MIKVKCHTNNHLYNDAKRWKPNPYESIYIPINPIYPNEDIDTTGFRRIDYT